MGGVAGQRRQDLEPFSTIDVNKVRAYGAPIPLQLTPRFRSLPRASAWGYHYFALARLIYVSLNFSPVVYTDTKSVEDLKTGPYSFRNASSGSTLVGRPDTRSSGDDLRQLSKSISTASKSEIVEVLK
jgi:hypothetical protein